MIGASFQATDLAFGLFLDGFITLVAIAVTAPLIGVMLVLRRMPLLALAGPQLASCGHAAASCVFAWTCVEASGHLHEPGPVPLFVGSLLMVSVGLVAVGLLARDQRFVGAYAAIAFVLAMAVEDLLVLYSPYPRVEEAQHHGQLLTADATGRNVVLAACALAIVVYVVTRRRQWVSAFDPDQARLLGWSPRRDLVTTLLLVGGYCAICAPIAGPLAVLTLMLLPPVLIRAVTPSLAAYAPLSMLAGVGGAVVAFLLACTEGVDWPPGPAVTLCVVVSSSAVAVVTRIVCGRR